MYSSSENIPWLRLRSTLTRRSWSERSSLYININTDRNRNQRLRDDLPYVRQQINAGECTHHCMRPWALSRMTEGALQTLVTSPPCYRVDTWFLWGGGGGGGGGGRKDSRFKHIDNVRRIWVYTETIWGMVHLSGHPHFLYCTCGTSLSLT